MLRVLSAIGNAAPDDEEGSIGAATVASTSVATRARSAVSLLRVRKAIGHTECEGALE